MPAPIPYSLYVFFMQPWKDVEAAWKKLLDEKERLLGSGIPAFEKLFQYADEANSAMAGRDESDPLWPVDKNTLRLLDVSLIEEMLSNTSDKVTRDAVSLQVLMIHSAMGLMKDADPYTDAEVLTLLNTQTDFYSDELLAYTLRMVLVGWRVENIVPMLFTVLARDTRDTDEHMFDWYGAVVYWLFLATVWRYLRYLEEVDQAFLVEHYFYRAVACGVPVLADIRLALDGLTAAEREARLSVFNQSLLKNDEEVPIIFPQTRASLARMLRDYLGEFRADPLNGFSQQQFADRQYKGLEYKDACSAWLRDAIHIAVLIRESQV